MREPAPAALDRFARFSTALITSGDVDPVYPVLKALYRQRRLDREAALWQTAIYLAYYTLPSGLAYTRRAGCAPVLLPDAGRYPCATERRGLRGGKVGRHLADLFDRARPSLHAWITDGWTDDPRANYERFWQQSQTVWGNGRWAAFKWSELLKVVHGYPLAAPDMRLEHGPGPKAGLCDLYGLPHDAPVAALNRAAEHLLSRARARGVPVADWETLETCLCNYHSHTQGRYEVGHDIEEMRHVIVTAHRAGWLATADAAALFEARAESFLPRYLGECRGH